MTRTVHANGWVCWLAAMVLAIAAWPALAADATMLVVSGSVSVTRIAANGSTSQTPLRSADELQANDLVSTGADGRAQIRFSDGAIVSLQPRTEFRIDEYRFDGQGQRGVFTLLRGALRTATGAIGKRDRSDYRMQTPTATIGIRGTDYVAEQTVCDPRCAPGSVAGLRVAVNEGRIAVTTSAGEIEVARGQAAQVSSPDALPQLSRTRPILNAPSATPAPRSDAGGSGKAGGSGSGSGTQDSSAGVASPGASIGGGSAAPGNANGLDSAGRQTDQGGTTAAQAVSKTAESMASTVTATAVAATAGSTSADNAATLAPTVASETQSAASWPARFGGTGTGTGTGTGISTGTVGNGPSTVVANGQSTASEAVGQAASSAEQITTPPVGAVVAPPASRSTGTTSQTAATSKRQDGTSDPAPATDTSTVVTAAKSTIGTQDTSTVAGSSTGSGPGISATADASTSTSTNTTTAGETASGVNTAGGNSANASNASSGATNVSAGSGIDTRLGNNPATVTSTTGMSDTTGLVSPANQRTDTGSLSIATLYATDSNGGGGTGGGGTGGGGTGGGGTGGGGSGGGGSGGDAQPTLSSALSTGGAVYVGLRGASLFDTSRLAGLAAHVEVDSLFRMTAVGDCPSNYCLTRNSASVADAGADPYVSWGRWTSGAAILWSGDNRQIIALGANEGIHYLLGVPTVSMPTAGSFSYELIGATSPTMSDGSARPGSLQASAVVTFAPGAATRVGLDGTVSMGDTRYGFTTAGGLQNPAASNLTMTGNSTFGGSLSTVRSGDALLNCSGNCRMDVRGGFFGPDAARMGIDYAIGETTGTRTINGVGVLNKR